MPNVMQQLFVMNIETLLKEYAAFRAFNKSDCVINMRIPHQILEKIKDSNAIDDIRDMRITILNRTERIGLPLAVELSRLGATVTICNSRTNDKDLEQLVKNSNIIITAMGNPNVIDYKHINKGQIWIDCSGDVSKQCLIDEINDGMGVYYGMRDVGNWTLDELMSRYYMEMGY